MTALVGQESERAWFQGRLKAGRGGVVLVVGEAGSGKTRLAEAWLRDAAAAGYRVGIGRCPDSGDASALRPWREALRSGGTVPAALPAPLGQAAAALDAYETAEQLAAWVAGQPPFALVLEDMQWADASSVELLRNLVGQAPAIGLLLIITFRSDVEQAFIDLCLRLGADRVALQPLTPAQVAQMALAAGCPERAPAIHRRSGGNPLLVTELLAAGGALTPTLRGFVTSRLDRLMPAQQETLQVAAVIGERFDLWTVRQVSGQSEEEILQALERAAGARLIREEGAGFAFTVPLVQEVLYQSMLAARRRRWHRLVADAVNEPDAVAFHLGEADAPEAVVKLREAGDRAMRAGERSRAASFYQQALRLAPAEEPERPALLLLAGAACEAADYTAACRYTREAGASAAATGNRVVGALARYREALLCPEKAGGRLMDEAHQAMEQVRTDPRYDPLYQLVTGMPPQAIGTPDGLAQAYLWSGRPDTAEALIRASAADTGSPDLGPRGEWVLAEVALMRGGLIEALAHYERAVRAAEERHDYATAAYRVGELLSLLVLEAGAKQQVLAAWRARVQELCRLAYQHSGSHAAVQGGPLLALWYWQGETDALRDAMVRYGQGDPNQAAPWWRETYTAWQARLECDRGDASAARQRLAALLPQGSGPAYGDYRRTLDLTIAAAEACRLAGDLAEAKRWLDTVDTWASGPRPSPWHQAHALLQRAELHLAAGEREEARAAAERCLALGQQYGATMGLVCPAHLLLARLGDADAAEHLRQGAAIAADSGSPLLQSRVRAVSDRLVAPGQYGLTRRELDVVRLVAQGLTDKEVGARLFLSPRTVDGHLRHIFTKLDLPSRAALVAWAARNGLLN
ncbi:MAG: ATP-binding protein [Mycobacterium leprae]